VNLAAKDLPRHLERGLASLYFLFGDETLLIEESGDLIRRAAIASGCEERIRFTADARFDWNSVAAECASPSLFATRRLIEIRLPGGKPGTEGGKALGRLAETPPVDTVIAVLGGPVDWKSRKTAWFRAVESGFTVVDHPAVDAAALPAWLRDRMAARGLRAGRDELTLLAGLLEGNLLAAAQEVDRLVLLCPDGAVTRERLELALADHARFDVFQLVDACLAAQPVRIERVLAGLRREGVEPVLVLWALGREIRTLGRMAAELAGRRPAAEVFRGHGIWSRRQPLIREALRRADSGHWHRLVLRVARVDRVVKGREGGAPWRELEALCLAMAGLRGPAAAAASAGVVSATGR